MRIEINRLNHAVHLEALNEDGNTVSMDGAPQMGGTKSGFRPMQMLLAGLGGCSAIDFIDILKKQRQDLQDFRIIIDGDREHKPAPSVFTSVHMHFKLQGNLDPLKVERALDLSINKYCSVGKMLEKTARITYSYEIAGEQAKHESPFNE
jgi:putative redox protein